jgi:ferric-dicitrate binding protein FerR (iron transport regulator)
MLGERRRRRLNLALAIAASIAFIALAAGWWFAANPFGARPVAATVAGITGTSRWIDRGGVIEVGRELRVPADGGVALATVDGRSLRLAAGARAEFTATNVLRLEAGRAYFDSQTVADAEHAPASRSFVIETSAGRVTHVGTQFAVGVENERVAVSVRSGAVEIATQSAKILVERGFAVAIGLDGHMLERNPIPTSGTLWDWADELAPELAIEGRTLAAVLRQIAEESGRRLEYASEDVRAACAATKLHGPPLDLGADGALAAVLATTPFDATIDEERVLISRRL